MKATINAGVLGFVWAVVCVGSVFFLFHAQGLIIQIFTTVMNITCPFLLTPLFDGTIWKMALIPFLNAALYSVVTWAALRIGRSRVPRQ